MGRNYGVKSYEETQEDKRIEYWVGLFVGVMCTASFALLCLAGWALYS